MEDLQKLLLKLFDNLDSEIKEIVSEVYAIEKEYVVLHQSPYGINEKIRDIVDKHARYQIQKGDPNEN